MKKITLIMSGILIFATMVTGCSRSNTKTEDELIIKANTLMEEEYEIKFDKEDYTYEVGQVEDDNKFTDVVEGEIPEKVFIRGTGKDKPVKGVVHSYSIEFNTDTDEVLSSECVVY